MLKATKVTELEGKLRNRDSPPNKIKTLDTLQKVTTNNTLRINFRIILLNR